MRFKRVKRVQRVPGEIVARLDRRQTLVVSRALARFGLRESRGRLRRPQVVDVVDVDVDVVIIPRTVSVGDERIGACDDPSGRLSIGAVLRATAFSVSTFMAFLCLCERRDGP